MGALPEIIEVAFFLLSGGLLFQERLRDNKVAFAVLVSIAIVSSLFLFKDVREWILGAAPPSVAQTAPVVLQADQYIVRGSEYLRNGNTDRALDDFNAALTLNPRYPEALNGRGQVYVAKGQFDLAIADYNAALAIRSDYADATANRQAAYDAKTKRLLEPLWADMNLR